MEGTSFGQTGRWWNAVLGSSQLTVIAMEMNGKQRLSCPLEYARTTACIKYQLKLFFFSFICRDPNSETCLNWALHLPLNASCHTENVESERSIGKKTAEQLQVAIKAKGENNLVSGSIICFSYTTILLWRTFVLDNINPVVAAPVLPLFWKKSKPMIKYK